MVDSSSDSNSESSHQSSDDENDEDIYIPGYCDIILIDGSFSSPTILHNVHYTNDLIDALENEEALISSCADAEKSNREIEKAAYRKRLLDLKIQCPCQIFSRILFQNQLKNSTDGNTKNVE